MLIQIVRHTPLWVWAMLAALLALGWRQTRPRRVARAQLAALPLTLLVLGAVSLAPVFARQPLAALLWLAALTLAGVAAARWPARAGARWDAAAAQLVLPGSRLPMALIVAIFSLKYGVGVALAMHPAWRDAAALMLPVALLYGALSGLLLGRMAALLRLCRGGARPVRRLAAAA